MKTKLTITALIFTIICFGQVKTKKTPGLSMVITESRAENDSIIKVIYKNEIKNIRKPAYFIKGKLVNESILRTLNPNEIESVKVEKEDIEIDNVKYFGKLIIATKSNYNPKLISLNNLKAKYTNLKDNSIIFEIDNEIVNENYENFIVDEKYILKIIVQKFENKDEKLNVTIVNLITKTEENIKKAKEIIIRGKNEFGTGK